MAKKAKKRTIKRYTKEELKTLKAHSKAKTPVDRIAKLMKRSGHSLSRSVSHPFQFCKAANGLFEGSGGGGLRTGSTWATASDMEKTEPLGSFPPAASL